MKKLLTCAALFALFSSASSFATPGSQTMRGIRNTKCAASEDVAKEQVFEQIKTSKTLCEEGYYPNQVEGWTCKNSGCPKGLIRCNTQFVCVGKTEASIEGVENVPVLPSPTPKAAPTPTPFPTVPTVAPNGVTPNPGMNPAMNPGMNPAAAPAPHPSQVTAPNPNPVAAPNPNMGAPAPAPVPGASAVAPRFPNVPAASPTSGGR